MAKVCFESPVLTGPARPSPYTRVRHTAVGFLLGTFFSGLLDAVLFSHVRFHDTTSRGRLLNRFGSELLVILFYPIAITFSD